jgi:asparagine synthase (glutamine-hydrolysing)
MCGIVGILRFNGDKASIDRINAMSNAIAHRGSDSSGLVIGGQSDGVSCYSLALGHRRLSVIDLSDEAAQPMFSNDRRFCLVYNGELYNYRELRTQLHRAGIVFRTQSDSEVILAAYSHWGRDCLYHFNGMFAFSIWDEERQSLFCARDQLGIKPFYYRLDTGGFEFSSESRSLANGQLNSQAIAAYFFSMYVPGDLSIHAGVNKLLPGCCIQVDPSGTFRIEKWWKFPAIATSNVNFDEAADQMQHLLDDAVALQIQSDVPVGILLSGGFDSGMILSSAAETGAKIHTYSLGFDESGQFNELLIANSIAKRYGSIHHEFTLGNSDSLSILDRALTAMSEPIGDSAVMPTWFLAQKASADGVKVLLSGTGGDEVFAGYSRYVSSSWRRKLIYSLPDDARLALSRCLPKHVWSARLRYNSIDMAMYAGGSAKLAARVLQRQSNLSDFLAGLATKTYISPAKDAPLLYQNMLFDLQNYLPDLLLMMLDQLCMSHTVEGRVPLLDINLIAYSYSLFPELHASPGKTLRRKLFRKMSLGRLDPRTYNAPKQGFNGPVRSWINSHEDIFRYQTLSLASINGLEELHPEEWWSVPNSQRNSAWTHEVFLMYCFAVWHEFNAH